MPNQSAQYITNLKNQVVAERAKLVTKATKLDQADAILDEAAAAITETPTEISTELNAKIVLAGQLIEFIDVL